MQQALAYFYMVAAWGGYVFIINIIPIYVVVMIVAGRYSSRLYIAYSTFYALGSIMAMQVFAPQEYITHGLIFWTLLALMIPKGLSY